MLHPRSACMGCNAKLSVYSRISNCLQSGYTSFDRPLRRGYNIDDQNFPTQHDMAHAHLLLVFDPRHTGPWRFGCRRETQARWAPSYAGGTPHSSLRHPFHVGAMCFPCVSGCFDHVQAKAMCLYDFHECSPIFMKKARCFARFTCFSIIFTSTQ